VLKLCLRLAPNVTLGGALVTFSPLCQEGDISQMMLLRQKAPSAGTGAIYLVILSAAKNLYGDRITPRATVNWNAITVRSRAVACG